jgi:hypothetical protein
MLTFLDPSNPAAQEAFSVWLDNHTKNVIGQMQADFIGQMQPAIIADLICQMQPAMAAEFAKLMVPYGTDLVRITQNEDRLRANLNNNLIQKDKSNEETFAFFSQEISNLKKALKEATDSNRTSSSPPAQGYAQAATPRPRSGAPVVPVARRSEPRSSPVSEHRSEFPSLPSPGHRQSGKNAVDKDGFTLVARKQSKISVHDLDSFKPKDHDKVTKVLMTLSLKDSLRAPPPPANKVEANCKVRALYVAGLPNLKIRELRPELRTLQFPVHKIISMMWIGETKLEMIVEESDANYFISKVNSFRDLALVECNVMQSPVHFNNRLDKILISQKTPDRARRYFSELKNYHFCYVKTPITKPQSQEQDTPPTVPSLPASTVAPLPGPTVPPLPPSPALIPASIIPPETIPNVPDTQDDMDVVEIYINPHRTEDLSGPFDNSAYGDTNDLSLRENDGEFQICQICELEPCSCSDHDSDAMSDTSANVELSNV